MLSTISLIRIVRLDDLRLAEHDSHSFDSRAIILVVPRELFDPKDNIQKESPQSVVIKEWIESIVDMQALV